MEAEPLYQYTIYQGGPEDFPGCFVVRKWMVDGSGRPIPLEILGTPADLESARALVPEGLFRIHPHPTADVRCLVETWV